MDIFDIENGKGKQPTWFKFRAYKLLEQLDLAYAESEEEMIEQIRQLTEEDEKAMEQFGRILFNTLVYLFFQGDQKAFPVDRHYMFLQRMFYSWADEGWKDYENSVKNGEKGGRPRKKKPENGEQIPPELPYN